MTQSLGAIVAFDNFMKEHVWIRVTLHDTVVGPKMR